MNNNNNKRMKALIEKTERNTITPLEERELNKLHKEHMKSIAPSWILDTAKEIIKP